MKKIIGYIIAIIATIVLAIFMWDLHACIDMFFLMSIAIFAGYAWEEWEELRAHRANQKRNMELSRR